MQHEQMLTLIISSGLEIVLTYEHQPRYIVGLHVDGRSQCDVIAFKSREAFEALTTEDAQKLLDASKADMLRAAKTKSGILKSDMKTKNENSNITVKSVKKKESETEKYLRQMRARGNRLAKTVKYG